uniref:Uncharacterized protein n=1 Tax=Anguilla anguilla TaxID=7936 RepID=A0A0E9S1C7_ANGAN
MVHQYGLINVMCLNRMCLHL